ncbi:MAG: GTPase ObgE [Candidatus Omnitrophica bacterium]|nr:GTPase ObgE [Candidatus Omnitrophota bacterium]
MNFVDEARISVKAGDGGNGCESHYRDKYMRHPIPDGGDGGSGGDVTLRASRSIHTLLDLKFQKHYQAERGLHGSSNKKRGRNGKGCVIRLPVGTIVRDPSTGLIIRDMIQDGEEVVIAKGGHGGHGNAANRKPSTLPGKGQELIIELELKVIADVGLIGFPNAGKSSIISVISSAKSKIASYPFTTKQPVLGIVKGEDFDFVVADLPGMIEGAHLGRGLGDRFLRHAQRAKILVHVIDMAGTEDRDPLKDYAILTNELKQYDPNFLSKHCLLVANKMDLPAAEKNLKRFRRKYKSEVFAVSAASHQGLTELVAALREIICHDNSPAPLNA